MPKIIVIRGPLGVGKTTIAKVLSEKIEAEYLSLDKILAENDLEGTDGIPVENFLKANEIIFNLIKGSEKSFVVDGCFYYAEQIEDLKKKFENDMVIFSLISSVEKCIERDSKRKLVYGEGATRYVHMITMKVREGIEIDNEDLTVDETLGVVLEKLKLE